MGINRSFSKLVLETQTSADEVASLAKDSEPEMETLTEFAVYVEKLTPILDNIRRNKIFNTPQIRAAIESLEAQLFHAKTCILSTPSSQTPAKHIQELTCDLGRCLGLLLFASFGVSLDLKEKIGDLHEEMMNAKFSEDSDKHELEIYAETQGIDDVVLQLKYGDQEEFRSAVLRLEMLVKERVVDREWIGEEGIIAVLLNRLGSTKCVERSGIIKLLRCIVLEYVETKEKMADVGCLTPLVRSLARDEIESREAVGLMMELSDVPAARRRMGRIKGCILMLVAILNGDDPLASNDARKILFALSNNTQNALLMAESGYFEPLIVHLKEGSEMAKILMATALSRMVLTDKARASLGENGAIQPLIIMFQTGKLEAKLSSLNALQNLSALKENVPRIIDSGILSPLLQLLFSVTSSLTTLREPAAAILARLASSESILANQDVSDQMLSLLNLSSSKVQLHILQALNGIASHSSASQVKSKMTQNGALRLLLPFLTEPDTKIRIRTLNLLHTISTDFTGNFTKLIGEIYLQIIVDIVSSSSLSETERNAAIALLGNIPAIDENATSILKKANILPVLISEINSKSPSPAPMISQLQKSVASILIRFTVPSNVNFQLYAVEQGAIPLIVKFLSNGSITVKSKAATALAQLSQNSINLTKPRKYSWACVPSNADGFCHVHERHCTTKGSFCLIKAGALCPLIEILNGEEREADEAVLSALATLMQDEFWEKGSNCIAKMSGIGPIIKVLEMGNVKAKEKAMWMLEKIFRVEDYRSEYGQSAQVVLIELAQKNDLGLRPTAAKMLAQLELLQEQSSYF